MLPKETLPVDWGVLRAAAQRRAWPTPWGTAPRPWRALALREAGGALGLYRAFHDEAHLDGLFSSLNDTAANILLLDPYWRPIYHSQPPRGRRWWRCCGGSFGRASPSPAWGTSSTSTFPGRRNGVFLVLQKPKTFTRGLITTFYAISAVIGVLCLVLCLWGAWLLSRHLSHPVQALSHAMGEVERGISAFSCKRTGGRGGQPVQKLQPHGGRIPGQPGPP